MWSYIFTLLFISLSFSQALLCFSINLPFFTWLICIFMSFFFTCRPAVVAESVIVTLN